MDGKVFVYVDLPDVAWAAGGSRYVRSPDFCFGGRLYAVEELRFLPRYG